MLDSVNTGLDLMGLALLKHSNGEKSPHSKLDGNFSFGKRGRGGGFAEPMFVLHGKEKLCWHC